MNQRKQLAKSIFMNALELVSESERVDFLRSECGDDQELRQEVEQLLRHCDEIDGFLDAPVLKNTADAELPEMIGHKIGPFKLLQQIGEGGFGIVYMAEQLEPVRRKVALKLVKPGMDSKQVIARFESERQALAMMDHPNIARAIDAGVTENGRPYFVMELIHGKRITQYCDEHRLTTRERLQLFMPVCRAIQHAHQRGIIHRDVKPSNVLVSLYDGQPVPKVIDFGVAKAVCEQLTEKTMFTQFGQVIGTPDYMSPEQATLNQLEVDTRSDIYGLGAVLYELLAGVPPFEPTRIRSAAFDEMLRIIREEDPQRPSLRLSTAVDAAEISQKRNTEPLKLSRTLHGDLDWIVMKALDKKRERRYETANGFANDIQRFLDNDTVHARPPTTAYKIRKFVARNRGFVVAATLMLATLLVGLFGTTIGFVRAKQQGKLAKESGEKAVVAQQLAERSARENRLRHYTSNIQLANVLWNGQNGSQRKVDELLTEWIPTDDQPDLRDFAWRYQWTQVHQKSTITKSGCSNATISVDGNLVTADVHGIHEWDDEGNLRSHRWSGDASNVQFASNGRWAATTENDDVLLIDLVGGTVAKRFAGPRYEFSADGNLISVWNNEDPVQVWRLGGQISIGPRTARDGESIDRDELAGEKPEHEVEEKVRFTGQGPVLLGDLGRGTRVPWNHGLRLSPDGKSCMRFWRESKNQNVTAIVDGNEEPVTWTHRSVIGATAWSADGNWMAVGTYTGQVYLRHVVDPNQTVQIGTHGKYIRSLCFSPDSKTLAVGGDDGTIDLWDMSPLENSMGAWPDRRNNDRTDQASMLFTKPTLIRSIKAHLDAVKSLAFSVDGRKLVSNDSRLDPSAVTRRKGYEARLWDLDKLENVYKIDQLADDLYNADFGIQLKNAEGGVEVSNLVSGASAAESGAIEVGDRFVGVANEIDSTPINLGGFDKVDIIKYSRGPFNSTAHLHFERYGDRFEVKLSRNNRLPPSPHRAAFSPDGKSLAVADDVQGATVWSLVTMTARRLPAIGFSAVYSPDGRYLAVDDGTDVVLWDLIEDEEHARLDGRFSSSPIDVAHAGGTLAISPDGRFLALGTGYPFSYTQRSVLKVWDLTTRKEVRSPVLDNKSVLVAMSFAPDGSSLIVVDHHGMLRIIDSQSWQIEREWQVGRAGSIALSPDGNTIAIGRWRAGTISLWDVSSGTQLRVLGDHVAFGLAFSADGRTLASGGVDHKVLLWDVDSGMLVRTLDGHTSFVAGIAFSADGTTLATVGNEGTLKLWKAASFEEIDQHPATLQSMISLGTTQNRHKRYSDAEQTLRRALRLQEEKIPPASERLATTRAEIIKSMRAQNKLPIVSRQPDSVKTSVGSMAEFTVHIEGQGPWSYQWFHNDQPIASATEPILQVRPKTSRDFGRYNVQVLPLGDNAATAVQSEAAYLVNANEETLAAGLKWEVFGGLRTGRKVSGLKSALPFRHRPDSKQVLSNFEIPSNVAHHYGGRLTGLLLPPTTGDYVFYLCSNDDSEFYLSSDDLPNQLECIAKVTTNYRAREWEHLNSESISRPIRLEAGKRYWVQVLFKENFSSDHLAVAWQRPGIPPPKNGADPISGEHLRHRGPI